MSNADHEALARVLQGVKGMVALSSYPSELYQSLYSGWTRLSKGTLADKGRSVEEVLWLSPNVAPAQLSLF